MKGKNLTKLKGRVIYRESNLYSVAETLSRLGEHLGGLLILTNLIEAKLREILLLLDLEINKLLEKRGSRVNINPVNNFSKNQNLTLGMLIERLKSYEFNQKDVLLKRLKKVNQIRKIYIHRLVEKPEKTQLFKRQGRRDFKELLSVLELLDRVDYLTNKDKWIGKRGRLLKRHL